MKIKAIVLSAVMVLTLAMQSASFGEVVGFNRCVVPANSDAKLTVPFNPQAEGEFVVATVTATGFTVADSLQADAFANAYYVRIISGNGEGLWTTITANTTSEITVDQDAVLGFLAAGDIVRVYKHYTLGSMFPGNFFGLSFLNGTNVLIYANSIDAMVQNKSAAKVAVYTTTNGGRWVGAGVNSDTILVPETQFIVRNNDLTQNLEVITMGGVPDYAVSMLIAAGGDLVIGSGYPVPVVLKNSGLAGNQRTVLFYDNADGVKNKSAVTVAAYTTSGGGRWVGSGVTGDELINPSQAVTLRLPATEAETKVTINKPY